MQSQFSEAKKSVPIIRIGLFITALIIATTTNAQTTATSEDQSDNPSPETNTLLEEITVTAQKRVQSLQDVPITIAVLTDKDLRQLGIKTAAEMTEAIPNVQMNTAGGFGNQIITIRGVGLNDYSLNNSPTAAVHVDEVYMSTNAMLGFSQFDLERVEVLKGPQGTLYGRNSTAGVVNYITRKPNQEFDAYVEATIGNWQTVNVEAAVGGGLTDLLSGRFAFRSENRGKGFQTDRVSDSKHGEVSRWMLRGQLQWDTDNVMALLSAHAGKDSSDEWLTQFEGTDDGTGAICSSALVGKPNPEECFLSGFGFLSGAYSDTDDNPRAGDYSLLPEIDDTAYGASLRLEFDFENMSLISLSAYEYYDYNHGEETDAIPEIPGLGIYLERIVGYEADQFSQEFRLTSFDNDTFNWLVGAFFTWETGKANELYISDFLVDGEFITDSNIPFVYKQTGNSSSVFAHAEWDFAENWRLTMGGRYAKEDKDWEGAFRFFLPPSTTKADWDDYAWKLALNYSVSDSTMLFGSISRGFKFGGIPGAPPTSGLAPEPYDSESNLAYELGFKSTFTEANIQLNGAVFFYDYQDMQGVVKNDPSDLAETLDNFGDVDVKGAELDMIWVPAEFTMIRAGIGWGDSKVKRADGLFLNAFGEPTSIVGNSLAHQPRFNANLLGRHEITVSDNLLMSFQADLRYSDDYYLNITNDESFAQNDNFTIWGARIALTGQDGKWDLALWGKNLSDEAVRTYGVYSLDNKDHMIYYNMPRSYGLTFTYFMF